jgi:hypothetical protein
MKKSDLVSPVVFAIVLFVIGLAIHKALNNSTPQATMVQVNHIASPSLPAPQFPPVVTISKVWPDGATPTKVVHVPDPQEPAKGVMNITLHQGDDVELDFDSLWYFNTENNNSLSGTETVIDDGSGFRSLQEYRNYISHSDQAGADAWWMKSRIVRMRLAAGRSDGTYSFDVQKKSVETESPLPPVPPQTFDDLTITESGLKGLSNHRMIVYLTFHNKSPVNTIAVALHDEGCTAMPCSLRSSLLASDGTPYVIDTAGITGINGLRTKPEYLISIEPGQELKASLTFEPRGDLSEYTKSFELQTEVVVNSNYQDYEYTNYRPRGDVLPPYCKIINVMFEIPIRWHHRD